MKISILSLGVLVLAAVPLAYGDTIHNRTRGPCFQVTIQADPVNHAQVEQNCDWNYSRTVQAGRENQAHTVQTGEVNNNKVRQYQYDMSQYFGRTRGRQRR